MYKIIFLIHLLVFRFLQFWTSTWNRHVKKSIKIDPKNDLENYKHFSEFVHRILMDLAPPRILSSAPVEAGS